MRRSTKLFTGVLALPAVNEIYKQYCETQQHLNKLSKSLAQTLVTSFNAAKRKENSYPAAALRDYQEIIGVTSREIKNGDIPLPANFLPELYTQAANILTTINQDKAFDYVNKALEIMPQFEPALELKKGILMERGKHIDDELIPKRCP